MYTLENIGKYIKELREKRNISRAELAERVGISRSHLEKIESGQRSPGMPTFWNIQQVLNENQSVQEKCALKAQEIILHSSEEKATCLTRVLECMSENMDMIIS